MTSQEIKDKILNYEMTDELLWESLDVNFKESITGIFNALYMLLINYDKNKELIEDLLLSLEFLKTKENNLENIKIFHSEIKRLNGRIFRNLNLNTNYELKVVVRMFQNMSKYLKQIMNNAEASKKIKIIENIINDNRNLKVISALIRDNKDIYKIKDSNNENILYKLLRKYSSLEDNEEKERNYLYQVISLFINSDDIEITKNIDYYISALNNKHSKHIYQIKRQLELKKHSITLRELEKKFGITTRYPDSIEEELNDFEVLHKDSVDLKNQYSITIDGEGSTCLDDAIYLKKNEDGSYYLYVHITFLPSLIPYNSKINEESIKRVETYYLIDDAYYLYPDYISNYLASLLPNNVRYTETGIWLVEPDMTIVEDSFKLVKSTIMSHQRLTYDEADEIIGHNSKTELCKMLTNLGTLALKQRKNNKTKETYRQVENAYSNNPIHESRLVDKLISANIVQECMLLFGRSKAGLYKNKGLPYIFRACGEIKTLDLDEMLIKGLTLEDQEQISKTVAYYTSKPERHYGLGYDAYCHGGSPARRSPDGQNQYIDEDLIFNPNPSDKTVYMWEEKTKNLASHYNEMTQKIDLFSEQYNYLRSKKLIKKK